MTVRLTHLLVESPIFFYLSVMHQDLFRRQLNLSVVVAELIKVRTFTISFVTVVFIVFRTISKFLYSIVQLLVLFEEVFLNLDLMLTTFPLDHAVQLIKHNLGPLTTFL